MSGRRYAGRSGDERRAERRQRLLDAGLERFGTTGYRDTTVAELCRAAQISARTFYEEFASREELLVELHDQLNARALEAVVAAIADVPATDVARLARAGVRAYLDVMTTDPRWARIALVESVGLGESVDAHRRAAIDRFATLIRAQAELLAANGVVAPRDFRLTATAVVGALNQLVMTWGEDVGPGGPAGAAERWQTVVDDVAEEAARLVVAAITAPPLPPAGRAPADAHDRGGTT